MVTFQDILHGVVTVVEDVLYPVGDVIFGMVIVHIEVTELVARIRDDGVDLPGSVQGEENHILVDGEPVYVILGDDVVIDGLVRTVVIIHAHQCPTYENLLICVIGSNFDLRSGIEIALHGRNVGVLILHVQHEDAQMTESPVSEIIGIHDGIFLRLQGRDVIRIGERTIRTVESAYQV